MRPTPGQLAERMPYVARSARLAPPVGHLVLWDGDTEVGSYEPKDPTAAIEIYAVEPGQHIPALDVEELETNHECRYFVREIPPPTVPPPYIPRNWIDSGWIDPAPNPHYLEKRRRATELLKRFLTTEQLESYLERKHFFVEAPEGRRFLVSSSEQMNITEVDKRGRPIAAYCLEAACHPKPPLEDVMLAQKMMIECDFDTFLAVAIRTPIEYMSS